MIAQEKSLANMESLSVAAQELQRFVEDAACQGSAAHEVEREVFRRVLDIGRTAMQHFFEIQGSGDLGATVTLTNGQVVRRLNELHTRDYVSIFGPFQLERTVYGSRDGQRIDFVPLDVRLELPESKFSYVLQDWDQMIVTEQPYLQVSQSLEHILGLKQHVDSLERMSRKMSDAADMFCWSLEAPPAEDEGTILVESADGKGVPIRRAADTPVVHDHQHRRGPKPDRKRMATVAAVYSVDRFERTPEQVVEALFRRPDEDSATINKRPRPRHKRVYACLSHEDADGDSIDGQVAAFSWMDQQARERLPNVQEMVSIMDGQESLWDRRVELQDDLATVEILDLLHVTSRLWQTAHLFHTSGSPEAEAFVRQRVGHILHGRVDSVVRGLRRMGSLRGLNASKKKTLATICGYFSKNRDRMRYDKYLQNGYPIASGVIEGACRHVVKDRLERTGMTWTKIGAQAVLNLRSIAVSGYWNEFQHQWVQTETERLYPHRNALVDYEWAITA